MVRPQHRSSCNTTRSKPTSCPICETRCRRRTSCDGQANKKEHCCTSQSIQSQIDHCQVLLYFVHLEAWIHQSDMKQSFHFIIFFFASRSINWGKMTNFDEMKLKVHFSEGRWRCRGKSLARVIDSSLLSFVRSFIASAKIRWTGFHCSGPTPVWPDG